MKSVGYKDPKRKLMPTMVITICIALLLSVAAVYAEKGICPDGSYIECQGGRDVEYLVNDINALETPYAYTIGGMEYTILEVLGALAVLGAIGFGLFHGLGRFIANMKNPIQLEKAKSVFIYNIIIRFGHWLNAMAVIVLLVTGFWMHYVQVSHLLGYIHNMAGRVFVVCWLLFIAYEILTLDVKQYIMKGWELKEGLLKQGLFYAIGIFKQEEHPYHMTVDTRLNPLQKIAYFGVMFGLVPLVGFTGLLLLEPLFMSPIVAAFGMENMKIVFIVHLAAAFGMLAYFLGHLYLATTGDKVSQHYKVMITGYHDEYHRVS